MNNRGRQHTDRCAHIGIVVLVLLFPATAASQADIENELSSAAAILTELDRLAENCFLAITAENAPADPLPESSQESCLQFLAAIDGDLLASYLQHCETVNQWRANVAEELMNDSGSRSTDNDTVLINRLIQSEFYCGENPLQNRTQFVVRTFDLLQGETLAEQRSEAALRRRLAELEFNAVSDTERQALINNLRRQQQQRQQAAEQQTRRLENEIIRQQIDNH